MKSFIFVGIDLFMIQRIFSTILHLISVKNTGNEIKKIENALLSLVKDLAAWKY